MGSMSTFHLVKVDVRSNVDYFNLRMELQRECLYTFTVAAMFLGMPTGELMEVVPFIPLADLRSRQDPLLDSIANATQLSVISVEYRLAPEHPFPAGPDDCYDVAEYLVDQSPSTYGGTLKFIGGESAGSTLTALTTLHLLESRPRFSLCGVLLNYGLFDLSLLPCARTWTNPLIMTTENIHRFKDAYLLRTSEEERRNPAISPMYHPIFQYPGSQTVSAAKYQGKRPRLPPALFLCGTQDAVLDDQVLMSFKWQIAGGEARIKFLEGAPHAFLLLNAKKFNITAQGRDLMIEFVLEKTQCLSQI